MSDGSLLHPRMAQKMMAPPHGSTGVAAPSSVVASSPPWERESWWAEFMAWLRVQLAEKGYKQIGHIEQIKRSRFSSVLRIPVADGHLYVKAVPTSFDNQRHLSSSSCTNEVALTLLISRYFPAALPAPISIERARGWLLFLDAGESLDRHPAEDAWVEALLTWSRFQQASTEHVEALLAGGCPDRRIGWLAEQSEALVNASEALRELTALERANLRHAYPRWQALCQRLGEYQIPAAVMHGDLHPGNVALREGRPVYLDWSEVCIGHPFFDAVIFCASHRLGKKPALRSQLRMAYLEPWRPYDTQERLAEAFSLAEPLARLHQAIRLQQCLTMVEPPWEQRLRDGLTFLLRSLLTA